MRIKAKVGAETEAEAEAEAETIAKKMKTYDERQRVGEWNEQGIISLLESGCSLP